MGEYLHRDDAWPYVMCLIREGGVHSTYVHTYAFYISSGARDAEYLEDRWAADTPAHSLQDQYANLAGICVFRVIPRDKDVEHTARDKVRG